MLKRVKICVISLTILLSAVIILVVCSQREQSTEPQVTVRIGYLNITASLPLFIAEERGFLAEEGVKYEPIPIATSNQLVDGLAAGNLDVYPESSAVPVLALELQSPGRIKVFSVSAISKNSPFDTILVRENSPITKLSDLAGKRIGTFPGSTSSALLKKFLQDKEVNVSNMVFIPIPAQNQLTALLEGSVDAVHAYEPTIAIALNNGGVRKLFGSIYAEMLEPNPQGVAAVSTRLLQEHPKTAKRVIRALERALAFMRENEAEARQIIAKRLNLNERIAKTTVFLQMLPHREIDPGVFQRYSDMLTGLGELKGQVKIENLLYRE